MSKRCILKVSGELFSDSNKVLAEERINTFAKMIMEASNHGIEIIIVPGGGNIWRAKNNRSTLPESDYIGLGATIINGLVLIKAFREIGAKIAAFSTIPIPTLGLNAYYSFDVEEKLNNKNIVIITGGLGGPGFSTDMFMVNAAHVLKADIALKATNVDGLYDKDPNRYHNAKPIKRISLDKVRLSCNDYNVMDIDALTYAYKYKIPIFVFLENLDLIYKAIIGEYRNFGSMIVP